MSDLRGLLEHFEALEGADRAFDGVIARDIQGSGYEWADEETALFDGSIPQYTASIDDALALVEKVLPIARGENYSVGDWSWEALRRFGGEHVFSLFQSGAASVLHSGKAPTFPLAILISLLRAKIAMAGGAS